MSFTPKTWNDNDILSILDLNRLEEAVAEMGNYTPTVWAAGDKITAEKMNKLEQGVAEGGGGSSDFSTAEVQINTNVINGVVYLPYTSQLMGIETAHTQKSIENSTVTAVLYKGNAVLTCSAELYNQATVSGNAQKVTTQSGFGYIKISGDCAISFGSIS